VRWFLREPSGDAYLCARRASRMFFFAFESRRAPARGRWLRCGPSPVATQLPSRQCLAAVIEVERRTYAKGAGGTPCPCDMHVRRANTLPTIPDRGFKQPV